MTRPPDPKLLGYLAAYDPHIASVALALRELVLEEAPEAMESIVKGYAVAIGFSFTGKPMKDGFCHAVAYAGRVNLGFNRGALMPDPNHVLKGTGKMIRHVTIDSLDDLERPYLRRYLRTAIEMVSGAAGAGAKQQKAKQQSATTKTKRAVTLKAAGRETAKPRRAIRP